MSRDIHQALEQLLDESRALNGNRPADIEAEAEALALYQMSRRLRRLRAQRAPARLRRSAWNLAMAASTRPQAKPALHLLDPAAVLRKAAAGIAALEQRRAERAAHDHAETEMDAAAVYEMSRRMELLRTQRAPDRLRRSAWNRAMAVPIKPEPQRRLWALEPPPAWFQAAGRVAASVLAVLTVGYGAVAASASSLPTSPLYPVKIFVEDIAVAVAPADQRSELFIHQANRRLDEGEALAKERQIEAAERVVEEATRTIESARTAAALSANPGLVQQAITSTETRARTTELTLEQNKPTSERPLGNKPVEPAVAPISAAPSAAPEITAPAPSEAPAAPRIEALQTPPDRTNSGPAAGAPVVSGGPAAASGSANAIAPRPVVAAPAGVSTVHPIDANDNQAAAPSPTRGGVSAPSQPFITVEPLESAMPAVATPAPTRTPTRTPTTQTHTTSPVPASSAGAPTDGYTILPVDRGTPAGGPESDGARTTR